MVAVTVGGSIEVYFLPENPSLKEGSLEPNTLSKKALRYSTRFPFHALSPGDAAHYRGAISLRVRFVSPNKQRKGVKILDDAFRCNGDAAGAVRKPFES